MGSDVDALVLDHARHGRERDERRDEEEDEREDGRDRVDALRLVVIAGDAHVHRAVEDVDRGLLEGIDIGTGGGELGGGIREAAVHLCEAVVIGGKAALVFLAALLELAACVGELGGRVIERALRARKGLPGAGSLLVVGAPSVRKLTASVVDLVPRVLRLIELRGRLLELAPTLIDLVPGILRLVEEIGCLGDGRIALRDTVVDLHGGLIDRGIDASCDAGNDGAELFEHHLGVCVEVDLLELGDNVSRELLDTCAHLFRFGVDEARIEQVARRLNSRLDFGARHIELFLGGLSVDQREVGKRIDRILDRVEVPADLHQLPARLLPLRRSLVELCARGIDVGLRHAELFLGLIELLAVIGNLLAGGVDICLRHAELRLRIVETALIGLEHRTGICELAFRLRPRSGKLSDSVIEVALAVGDGSLGILELVERSSELLRGIRELLVRLRLPLVVLLLRIGELRLRLLLDLGETLRGKAHPLDAVRDLVDARKVVRIAADQGIRAFHGHEDLREGQLIGEGLGRDEHVLLNLAGSEVGVAERDARRVERGMDEAAHAERAVDEDVVEVRGAVEHLDGIADLDGLAHDAVRGEHAFVGLGRPASASQREAVEVARICALDVDPSPVRDGRACCIHIAGHDAHRIALAVQHRHDVGRISAHDLVDALDAGDALHLLVGQAER